MELRYLSFWTSDNIWPYRPVKALVLELWNWNLLSPEVWGLLVLIVSWSKLHAVSFVLLLSFSCGFSSFGSGLLLLVCRPPSNNS